MEAAKRRTDLETRFSAGHVSCANHRRSTIPLWPQRNTVDGAGVEKKGSHTEGDGSQTVHLGVGSSVSVGQVPKQGSIGWVCVYAYACK